MKADRFIYIGVVFLLYWISFEWAVLSIFKNYDIIRTIRIVNDGIPGLLLILYFCFYPLKSSPIVINILFAFALIFLLALISVYVNGGRAGSVISNLGVGLRFVPLIVITNLKDKSSFEGFYGHVVVIFICHIFLSIIQLVDNDFFFRLFLPDRLMFTDSLPTAFYHEGLNSTFINNLDFAYLILGITAVLMFNTKRSYHKWAYFTISFIIIMLTKSLASLVGLIIIGFFVSRRRIIYSLVFSIPLLAILFLNKSLLENMIGTPTLWEWLTNSEYYARVGFFTKVLPQFLTGDIRDLVLGMSLDEAVVDSKIELYNDLPLILTYGDSTLKLLKDVYWISIIVSQGIIAFLLYLYILFKVFKTSVLNRDTNAGEMVFAMLTLVIILGFFNQVLDQKCLSFFFWLMVSFLINNVRYTGRKIFKNPFKLNTNPLPTHSPK
jgi:hypothetical protein